jgi:hypothetical protein
MGMTGPCREFFRGPEPAGALSATGRATRVECGTRAPLRRDARKLFDRCVDRCIEMRPCSERPFKIGTQDGRAL